MDYSTLTKAQLQDEIDQRNKDRDADDHLNRTGTNPELIARLQADDVRLAGGEDEDLLAEDDGAGEGGDLDPNEPDLDGPDPDVMGMQIDPEAETGEDTEATVAEAAPAKPGLVTPRLFEARYEMHGSELGTALHQEFLTRVGADAAAAGHNVKGGPYRERIENEGGKTYAVYRVTVRG